MKNLFFVLVIFQFSFSCFSQPITFSSGDTLRGTLSKERRCFDVTYYDLSISVNVNDHTISGCNSIHFSVQEDFSTIQIDLYQNLSIQKITDSENRLLSYSRKNNAVFIRFHTTQKKEGSSFIKIYYKGTPNRAIDPPWDGGFVWSLDSLNRSWISVTCEGVGASLWWPCKDHPSDEPDSMRMHFEVPQEFFCASNGKLLKVSSTIHQTKIYEWMVSYPINTYNVTLNIGHYIHFSDTYVRQDNTFLELDYYVLSYNFDKAKKHFEQVKPMIQCYEKLFGNYPYEKDGYALIEAPYWGMEHQSGIAYGNHFKNNLFGFDYIIVHESGHEWWGNNISVADHADLWIHEAFTTYGETLMLECLYNKETAENYLLGQTKYIKNREPIIGLYNVNYHYWKDSDMYYKGARMLHTLRNSIDNDSLWFALLLHLQEKFSSKQIGTEEMIACINNFTGFNYRPFFLQYLTKINLPILEYEILKKSSKHVHLKCRWVTEVSDFRLPLTIGSSGKKDNKFSPSDRFENFSFPVETDHPELEFNTNSFYITLKELNRKKRK
ncbi:MAG TPA: M1 family metallopeptidase [Cytophagaceae bacterium]|jgi:aminopeptidase N|nr:M1 family metallopeptidase [Cytophagaceae bacterium]